MKYLFRSPIFWAISALFSIGCIIFTLHFFSSAFPIVHIDLKIDREQALKKADDLAKKYGLSPRDYQQAIQFSTDTAVKTFIELDAGGVPALIEMIDKKLYMPYTWTIRHFQEFEHQETEIVFTPDGSPYGFTQTLSETMAGAALQGEQAQKIAEHTAAQNWNIDFTHYMIVEASREIRSSGRIDHTFIYERHEKIGEGLFRLRLVVSGDTLTALNHYVKIPEEFQLRYQEMRSSNESLAYAAHLLMILLYIVGGSILGLIFLARERFILWKTPILIALTIAVLQALTQINQLPLLWFYYDTALPKLGFLLNYSLSIASSCASTALMLTIIFITAESLSRKAFGNHLQFWKLWAPRVAASPLVAAQTIGAYLLVPFDLAFGVAFYFLARRYLGWWVPADELINPNIVAMYVPWLTPVVQALIAGFKEECIFRAIPLAGAALIGKRFGHLGLWVMGSFIVQAIIFGAAHASYAAQPYYARLFEILVPSFVWGTLYLAFGLLPAIISHVIVDIVWMALPLFVSSASGALLNQLCVITCALIPIAVIIFARLKVGIWQNPAQEYFNKSWQSISHVREKVISTVSKIPVTIKPRFLMAIIVIGCVAALIWTTTTKFEPNSLPVRQTRDQAIEHARRALTQRGIVLDASWETLSTIHASFEENIDNELQHKFIWQAGGNIVYEQLLKSYFLLPAYWIVRFVKFHGPVRERAEEYQFFIAGDSTVISINHKLPEMASGEILNESEARLVAHAEVQNLFSIDPATIEEISATDFKLPARKDWLFIFADKNMYPLNEGQARIAIALSGNSIATAYRYIHVPETWTRAERNIKNLRDFITSICTILFYLFSVLAIFVALRSLHTFSVRSLMHLFCILSGWLLISLINAWPDAIATFTTSEPFSHQLFTTCSSLFLQLLMKAALYTIIIFATSRWPHLYYISNRTSAFILGIVGGAFMAGIIALLHLAQPCVKPVWADFNPLVAWFPILGIITKYVGNFLTLTMKLLLLFVGIETMTHFWQRHKVIGVTLMIFAGLLFTGIQGIDSLWSWMFSGIMIGVLLLIISRFIWHLDYSIIPITTATYAIFHLIQQAVFNAIPGILMSALLASVFIGGIAVYWSKIMRKH